MKALVFDIPGSLNFWRRHGRVLEAGRKILNGIGAKHPGLIHRKPLSSVGLQEIKKPELPGVHWERVRPVMTGICGSDMALVHHKLDESLPFSYPCVMGHETVVELENGKRAVLNPLLPCKIRGLPPCINCKKRKEEFCLNFEKGIISPGMFSGFTEGVPGGCAEETVAHTFQIHPLPDRFPSQRAVLAEPMAVAVHAVLNNFPSNLFGGNILVVGGGMMAYAVLVSLREFGFRGKIIHSVALEFQADVAKKFGADEVLFADDSQEKFSDAVGGGWFESSMSRLATGGVDITFDCIATPQTIDQSLSCTKEDGAVVLVGMSGVSPVNLTHVIARGKRVVGSFAYGTVRYGSVWRQTFDVAIELLQDSKLPLEDLVTHKFKLEEYSKAFDANIFRKDYGSVKTVFEI